MTRFTFISKWQSDFELCEDFISWNFAYAKFRWNKTLAKISEFTVSIQYCIFNLIFKKCGLSLSECQIVWVQISTDIMSVLTWVQTVSRRILTLLAWKELNILSPGCLLDTRKFPIIQCGCGIYIVVWCRNNKGSWWETVCYHRDGAPAPWQPTWNVCRKFFYFSCHVIICLQINSQHDG